MNIRMDTCVCFHKRNEKKKKKEENEWKDEKQHIRMQMCITNRGMTLLVRVYVPTLCCYKFCFTRTSEWRIPKCMCKTLSWNAESCSNNEWVFNMQIEENGIAQHEIPYQTMLDGWATLLPLRCVWFLGFLLLPLCTRAHYALCSHAKGKRSSLRGVKKNKKIICPLLLDL